MAQFPSIDFRPLLALSAIGLVATGLMVGAVLGAAAGGLVALWTHDLDNIGHGALYGVIGMAVQLLISGSIAAVSNFPRLR